ncbi:hypothetical protein NBRC10512_002348 [Rhodotorula toruloides]|uniref:RHTO0S08e05182g1_1 n=2 Tax=Rhodotorula toruloides TaxID=5286 RepID=A0A061B2Q8_RHOTO|nr:2-dehydropantoate 2-reductase [Rhodotorula toruloides NP11]EMS22277.1 2-dehydropantoate 2-reductase [Rhodotorula toruloides NP11]KAJ8294683.1 putative 2-dehydropantoate 2-reductase [Rhodotorula toruloides]CDR43746.1 RHTO0S08e05182g1_1 [Rhodotorula toruloides]
MRFHCLGVGSIGSLIATNLAQLPFSQVRLILRRKDLAAQLLKASGSAPRDASETPYGTITVERNGLARRTSNLEMELTRSPNDAFEQSSVVSGSRREPPRIDPRVWNRNDPISTLIVTTKAPATLPAMQHLLPRLSSRSTIVLCQNGMGVLETLLERYWPEDRSDEYERALEQGDASKVRQTGGRPSFVCATTTHGAWRKSGTHFVHAGMGDIKFGVVPNRAILSNLNSYPTPPWPTASENPLLNPRSLVDPTLDHLPYSPVTASLHTTVSSLLSLNELNPTWLPLPTLQIAQLQKLAVNASVNSITALVGVNNGALVGSQKAKRIAAAVCRECSDVFAAHLAREDGRWEPPPALHYDQELESDDIPSSLLTSISPSHPPPPPLPSSHPLSAHSLLDYTLRVLFRTSTNISSTLADLAALTSNTTPDRSSLAFIPPNAPSRTEIEFINGYVAALGRRYGIRTDTVRTLGEMVLLKEEMGRVGAIDRVWKGRDTGRVASPVRPPARDTRPARPAREKEEEDEEEKEESEEDVEEEPRPATEDDGPTSVFPNPRPRSRTHPYDRAAKHIQRTREVEARVQSRRVDRVRERSEERSSR